MTGRFVRLVLRTFDVDAARAFYGSALGFGDLDVVPLHEQAIARGARPHWLGMVDVGDVDRAVETLVARGGSLLGPKWTDPTGLSCAVARDPGGALVGLAKPAPNGPMAPRQAVSWIVLNTAQAERTAALYRELCGWDLAAPIELAGLGRFQPFAYRAGEPPVGAIGDLADRPGVHPHWLFHFAVPDVARAMDAVKAHGGSILPVRLPDGELVAVCDDPQGTAFALRAPR